ncbi:hypothetical protein [Streptomyces yaizuensis]|uniref:Uncharacterized protein n=1 Tax=Streptomyces yaizuensis TaxID=2989713 RepID=A0ABQ5P4U1_9ACTN|nr:hypothetical protein [Streptomyces sp. YSPA8]GLF97602.1 hypothetical protein SYYSPA8_24915 [Streptomyces sp. YSPA8]
MAAAGPAPDTRRRKDRDGLALALTVLTLLGLASPTLILGDHVHEAARSVIADTEERPAR